MKFGQYTRYFKRGS